jgi:hypothetical protein
MNNRSPSESYPVLCLNLDQVLFLLSTTARARALQQKTHLEWRPYKDSKVLNAIYAVLRWKEGPGTVEVAEDLAGARELEDKFLDEMFDTFLVKAADDTDPATLHHYLDGLLEVRDSALDDIQGRYVEAAEINREIAGATGEGIRRLASIRLASTVTLIGASCALTLGGSAVAAEVGGIKLGYDVLGEVVKGWEEAESTKAIAIGSGREIAKFLAEREGDKAAEHVKDVSEEWVAANAAKLGRAQVKVRYYSMKLARRITSRKAKRGMERAMAKQSALSTSVSQGMRAAKAAKTAKLTIPIVFAAWDLWNAFGEYQEQVHAAR